mmetsp:Transcript_2091/g.6552  ORF Transcript_2091/g.6552 Transcript_2091/m.6552 type:complete len:212 (-) Transcript_2091:1521-2156(-)
MLDPVGSKELTACVTKDPSASCCGSGWAKRPRWLCALVVAAAGALDSCAEGAWPAAAAWAGAPVLGARLGSAEAASCAAAFLLDCACAAVFAAVAACVAGAGAVCRVAPARADAAAEPAGAGAVGAAATAGAAGAVAGAAAAGAAAGGAGFAEAAACPLACAATLPCVLAPVAAAVAVGAVAALGEMAPGAGASLSVSLQAGRLASLSESQ